MLLKLANHGILLLKPVALLNLWDALQLLQVIEIAYEQKGSLALSDPTCWQWVQQVIKLIPVVGGNGIPSELIPQSEIERIFCRGEYKRFLVEDAQSGVKQTGDPALRIESSGNEMADVLAQLMVITQGSPLTLQIAERLPLGTINAMVSQWAEHHRDPNERKMAAADRALSNWIRENEAKLDQLDEKFFRG